MVPLVCLQGDPVRDFEAHSAIKKRDYHTVAGFIMTYLGRIPMAGEKFTWDRSEFEIVDMDGNRIDKILLKESPSHR